MAETKLRFDGKVVLVTGGGRGIGREYALAFGNRGAKVVVNDLGSDISGDGKNTNFADEVVKEIIKNGGEAIPSYDSVEYGDRIIKTVIENFGKIDIVINNAAGMVNHAFGNMSDDDWDKTIMANLTGAFRVTRAAWPYMQKQKYGRVIFTSSTSGINGMAGQTSYGAGKTGLIGLANCLAIEGKKFDINVNTIAPIANSRLTQKFFNANERKFANPKFIAPIVLYLCHESCSTTGGLFNACGGAFSQIRWEVTKGAILKSGNQEVLPEDVRNNWGKITDWNKVENLPTMQDKVSYQKILERIDSGENDLYSTHPIQPNIATKIKFPPIKFPYNDREVMLYAAGIGASTTDESDLKFLFELHEDFSVIPTFGVLAPGQTLKSKLPGLDIDPTKIVHGEQYMKLLKPLRTSGELTVHQRIPAVLDKGSGAAMVSNYDVFDEGGDQVCMNQSIAFIRGFGNFGGKRNDQSVIPTQKPPKRKPDAIMRQKTSLDQAMLYRLSGDRNPLHISKEFAARGGFATPILHGLCTLGFSTRHVIKTFANNDAKMFEAIKVRFASPVLPGQTLQTEMWKEGKRIHFQTVIVETGKICLSDSYIDLLKDSMTTSKL